MGEVEAEIEEVSAVALAVDLGIEAVGVVVEVSLHVF